VAIAFAGQPQELSGARRVRVLALAQPFGASLTGDATGGLPAQLLLCMLQHAQLQIAFTARFSCVWAGSVIGCFLHRVTLVVRRLRQLSLYILLEEGLCHVCLVMTAAGNTHKLQALLLAWTGDIPELWGTLRMFAARPG